MENSGIITKKINNTTVIIHPGTAQSQSEIDQVNKDLENALRKAWLNISINK